MVKPIKTAGKSQRQQIAMATTKKRSASGAVALKEIKKQQKSTRKCIPKSTFKSLVLDITSSILAERADTTGRRSTKNSQRNTVAIPSISSTGSKSSSNSTKGSKIKVKKEVKTEVKTEIKVKKERKIRIK